MSPRSEKSTTVRSLSHRTVRGALGALQAVAPDLAGRVAARLFMTPPRYAKPPAAWGVSPAAPFAFDGRRETLRGLRLGHGPAVLLVHGWGGRGDQLAAFAPALVAAGCSVVVFDGPAHGASTGRTTNLPELADAVGEVAARFGARAAIAHSLGAAATSLALRRGLALDAVVLVAPPRNPAAYLGEFTAAMRLRPEARDALRRRIERRVGLRMSDLDVPRFSTELRTPALVIHDRSDREVSWEDGASIAAAWPDARLVTTARLGHRRILEDPGVVADATAFVVERLPRCDCGRLAPAAAQEAPRCESCLLELYLADVEERAPGAAA